MSKSKSVGHGLYRIHWKSGGDSLAAIGVTRDGGRWLAPVNWVSPATSDNWMDDVKQLEKLTPFAEERRIKILHSPDGILKVEADGPVKVLTQGVFDEKPKVVKATIHDDPDGDFVTTYDDEYDEVDS